ncbi:MAG TPA: tetratricopeptide repeat protein [Chitinophagales bacterium]|nr:tetratricopeptide repeat protein [Chitinophagales bacterium]
MQKGQLILGFGTLALALALYFGGKTVQKKADTHTTSKVESISLEQYAQLQIAKLADSSKTTVSSLLDQLKEANKIDTTKTKEINLHLSRFWKNVGNEALGTYYFYQFAQIDQTKDVLANAGDALVSAYKNGADSTISNNLITFALRSYEQAAQKDGRDIELQIKIADVYVQGSQEPMKGIGILRHLADSLPNNIPVSLALGRLSIQSGQFDKAKERFKKVLQLDPQNTEALYFLAITEAQLGHNEEAIRLFEMCKTLVNKEDFNKEIDEIVNSLKNKKV